MTPHYIFVYIDTCSATLEVLQLLRTIVLGQDPCDHLGRDTQLERMQEAAIPVEGDGDETIDVVDVWQCSHRFVAKLIVAVHAQDDGPPPVVVLAQVDELMVMSVGDDPTGS